MSTVVDNRVVEMQFDNAQFERNVSTSLSTLDKLKQKLNLTGAAKGLEDIDAAARNVNFSGLGSAVDSVGVKFNALWTVADQTLRNITNRVEATAERWIKSLSVDQITAGWQKFGNKTTSVATLVAQGNDLDTVNEQLDRLNWFTDETSYNFTDMVSNIAKFTATGKGLEESVTAMEGIANWAALSGQNASTASHAMYQLSQAMGAGVMRLEDYKSIQNASMDTEEFRQKCIEAGISLGTLKDNGDGTYSSLVSGASGTSWGISQFANNLTKEMWLTSDVMMEVFNNYSSAVDGIYSAAEDKGMLASELIDEIYSTAEKKGISTDEAIKELGYDFDSFALKAFESAQKARTFGDAVDSVKDAVSTGWMNTFEIIFGDAEEATELWTDLANAMYDVFAAGGEARNEMLSEWKELGGRTDLIEAFWNVWDAIASVVTPIKDAFNEIFPALDGKKLASFTSALKSFTEKLTLSSEASEKLKRTFKGVFSIFDIGRKILVSVGKAIGALFKSEGFGNVATFLLDIAAAIGDFFTSINEGFDSNGLTGVLSSIVTGIANLFGTTVTHINSFTDLLSAAGGVIANVGGKIWDVVKKVFGWFSETFSAGDIFAGLAGGGIFVAAKKLSGFLDGIIDAVKGLFGGSGGKTKMLDQFKEILGGVKDSLGAFTTGIKVGSLVSIAVAIGILSASLKTISGLDTKNVVKSLSAIGIMMVMLSKTLSSITKTLGKTGSGGLIKAGASLVLVATAINILANAIEKIGNLPLKDICKGLIGVGGGLVELSVGLKIIGKTKISLSTSVAMLALAESCKILGDALQKFGAMSWDEIGRGLTGMAGALTEFVVAIAVLQKVGGFKSLLGSASILLVVQSLDDMAEGLKKFGGMAWDEIGRGLTAMAGALIEVGGISGAVGKLAGISGLFGSGTILATIQGLDDLANGLQKFSSMSWDEIGRGLAAMGGALVEVGGISGAVGYLTSFAGIVGAGTIWIAIQGLDQLATNFQKFGSMSWDEIGRGLVAMGGALLEVAVISGVTGYLTNFAGLVGAGTLALAVQGLDQLATAFQKFGEMSWDEIDRGLTAMDAAMGETALGGVLNTFSGLGALSISTMAESLGVLADSVQKWADVTVPEGLGEQLGTFASGIMMFNFSGLGANSIATVAEAIGVMADSVKKWAGVVVPDDLPDKLKKLANGVEKFTLSGIGASALADAAPAIGTLADGVKKWSGVTVPENIEDDMTSLANGVKAFSFAFAGGWSMSAIVGPLGDMADSVKKWMSVSVSKSLEDGLTSLANGIKAFSFAFVGGWSMSAIVGPLGDMADSIKSWTDVTVPEGLGDNLKSVAEGIKPFGAVGDISGMGDSLTSLASGVTALSNVGFDAAASGLSDLTDAIAGLASTNAVDAGLKLITGIANGISKGQTVITAKCNQIISGMFEVITSHQVKFQTTGVQLISRLAAGISSQRSKISNAIGSALNSAVSKIKEYFTSFYNAGSFVVSGFVLGITANTFRAEAAAAAMAEAALESAREALDVNSPSKVFRALGYSVPEGFAMGIDKLGGLVTTSSTRMTDTAIKTVGSAISRISDIINSNVNTQPTIKPVLDLSDVRAGIGGISDLMPVEPSLSVSANIGAISSMMARRGQNGETSEVVSAINKLRKDLGNVGNTSYNINGVTYDDSSEVADAVRVIARAIKVEGRV